MIKQTTISQEFILEGKGLHTGLNIKLKACPAPSDTGYIIRRTDLPNKPEMEAIADHVTQTVRGTVLRKDDMQVSTVEHALAAFYSMGIDNCIFEVDAPEFPILDGSAIFYVQKIMEVGIRELDSRKKFIEISENIVVENENGSRLEIIPAEDFSVEVEIGFGSEILPNQTAKLKNLKDFAENIASCRTFVFVREIEPLLQMNLIKGGDLKNAIVIYDRIMSQEAMDTLTEKLNQEKQDASRLGYLSGPLKFENEPARHKLLDVIGDLALTGHALKAHIKAHFPGHGINTETAMRIRNNCFFAT